MYPANLVSKTQVVTVDSMVDFQGTTTSQKRRFPNKRCFMALGVAAMAAGVTITTLVRYVNRAFAPIMVERQHRKLSPSPASHQRRDTPVSSPSVPNTSPNVDTKQNSLRGTEETSVDRDFPSRSPLGPSSLDTVVDISALVAQYSISKKRTFYGPRLDIEIMGKAVSGAPPVNDEGGTKYCKRWAVLTTCSRAAGPTEIVQQLSMMEDWCVVVVSDKDGLYDENAPGVTYLSPSSHQVLPYRITSLLKWNHFGRKNIGYLYAIHHGAKVIFDVGEGTSLRHPESGIPHSDSSLAATLTIATSVNGLSPSLTHRPCTWLGAPAGSWPRGFPPEDMDSTGTTGCDVVAKNKRLDSPTEQHHIHGLGHDVSGGDAKLKGIIQDSVIGDPDLDALYRLTRTPPFQVEDRPVLEEHRLLDAIPETSFTPYNAQSTLHFPPAFWGLLLPTTVAERVSDIWRSYFTQALLPSTGAVVAFASPWVARHDTNTRNTLLDLHVELPLYERSGALVAFLVEFRAQIENTPGTWMVDGNGEESAVGKDELGLSAFIDPSTLRNMTLPQRIESLMVMMYECDVIEEEDVVLAQAWLQDLATVGYTTEHFSMGNPITPDENQPAAAVVPTDRSKGEEPKIQLQVPEYRGGGGTGNGGLVISTNGDMPPQRHQPAQKEALNQGHRHHIDESLRVVPFELAGRRLSSRRSPKQRHFRQNRTAVRDGNRQRHQEIPQTEQAVSIDEDEVVGVDEALQPSPEAFAAVDLEKNPTASQAEDIATLSSVQENQSSLHDNRTTDVLLVIAVVSIRPDRRSGIRDSWLLWADDRVVVRFFTEAPGTSNPATRSDAEMQTKALEEEAKEYEDLIFLDIDRGMNFALKLVMAMQYLSERYTFDFFLRLDDDYFLCLPRLLGELEVLKNSGESERFTGTTPNRPNGIQNVASKTGRPDPNNRLRDPPTPLLLYAGHRYCTAGHTRMDEAYLLLSGTLVDRVLSTPHLICSKHAGISTGYWFTNGNPANPTNDVTWVHDSRLDHDGRFWEKRKPHEATPIPYNSVCLSRIGVHHTYTDNMRLLWGHVSGAEAVLPGHGLSDPGVDEAIVKQYSGDGMCATGVSQKTLARDAAQSCDGFHADIRVHCGKENCPHH